VDARALLPDDDRPEVDFRGGLQDRIHRVPYYELHTLTLEDFGDCIRCLHGKLLTRCGRVLHALAASFAIGLSYRPVESVGTLIVISFVRAVKKNFANWY